MDTDAKSASKAICEMVTVQRVCLKRGLEGAYGHVQWTRGGRLVTPFFEI